MHEEPVYRGILGIDIERYSRAAWTDPIRGRLRERLHRLVDHALALAGIDPDLTRRSDVGDGLWLLVAAEVSAARLLHPPVEVEVAVLYGVEASATVTLMAVVWVMGEATWPLGWAPQPGQGRSVVSERRRCRCRC